MSHESQKGTMSGQRETSRRLWQEIDFMDTSGELDEGDEEARAFDDEIHDEITKKVMTQVKTPYGVRPVIPGSIRTKDMSRPSKYLIKSPTVPVEPTSPNISKEVITHQSIHEGSSTHPLASHRGEDQSYPYVQTPSFGAKIPSKIKGVSQAIGHSVNKLAETPQHIPSPIDTPQASGSRTVSGEGRGRRDDPTTPAPLGVDRYLSLAGKREYQTLTKHFEQFSKQTSKANNLISKGKGSHLHSNPTGRLFEGLRFCLPPEIGNTSKQKQWWGVILTRGGQVTLQPDTSITHVIHNSGRSAQLLARQLGLQSLSELPEGTVCVKWDWVAKCVLEGRLLETTPWLSFPSNVFTRTVSANVNLQPQKRLFDITAQLRANSVSISRKRGPTASESDTESPQKPQRMPIPARPTSEIVRSKKTRTMDVPTIATEHSAPSGPGWEDVRESERDGLDEMISGLKDGSIWDGDDKDGAEHFERLSRDTPPLSDDHANEHPIFDSNPDPNAKYFKCGQSNHSQVEEGPNDWLAKKFEEMHDMYQVAHHKNTFQQNVSWDNEEKAESPAAGVMRRTSWPIKSGKDALKIKGIGQGMADRIDEWISRAPGRQFYETTEEVRVTQLFKDVYGVGKTRALEFYQKGARTLDDLRSGRFNLTEGQKIGLELYDDLQTRIPRSECRAIYEVVRDEALLIDPRLEIEIMGSYRRGAADSGDVDFLITRDDSDGINHAGVLEKLVRRLAEKGVITHSLGSPGDWTALEAKWMGVCRLNSAHLHRRIDILCIPFEQWGAALIYFTGNDIFNRSLRLYARKKGYSLNQRGLYHGILRGQDGLKMTEGTIVASRTEQEIFDVLGIRWRAPHHRRP